MAVVNVGQENSAPVDLYYEDLGEGEPVVLLAGWPFDARSWEPQIHPLLAAGYRIIAYDRRGFGRSSRPLHGYDFDVLAEDLHTLLAALDLTGVTLVGLSLGTGELARYIGMYGTERLARCVFIESLAPSFAKSSENPQGVDEAGVEGVQSAILADRAAWLSGMLENFLNLDDYRGSRISDDAVRDLWNAGMDASPWGTRACVRTWLDDFAKDIERIDVPTLILHGTADRILSLEGQGRRLHASLPDARYQEIDGGPHVMSATHAEEVNAALLAFIREPVSSTT